MPWARAPPPPLSTAPPVLDLTLASHLSFPPSTMMTNCGRGGWAGEDGGRSVMGTNLFDTRRVIYRRSSRTSPRAMRGGTDAPSLFPLAATAARCRRSGHWPAGTARL